MSNPRIYLRQGNIIFSKRFIETLRNNDVIPTRRDNFIYSGVVVNHGNSKPFTVNPSVKELYMLNKPDAIHLCCNKKHNWNILKDFYPKVYSNDELKGDINFPIIAKPLNGHHGYGIIKVNNRDELNNISNKSSYIFQDFVDIKHEFRFNVLDKEVYQVSHRDRRPDTTEKGGYLFDYRSLADFNSGMICDKFRNWVKSVLSTFHESIGTSLCHYTIDVMKGMDGEYYLSEINSACGIGEYTLNKLISTINTKYENGELDKYKVR